MSGKTALILNILLLVPTFFLYGFVALAILGFAADGGPDMYDSALRSIGWISAGIASIWIASFGASIALYSNQRYGWSVLIAALPIMVFAALIIAAVIIPESGLF